ncbi:hypothetical protein BDY19DRAFT_889505 [Irpex rosettiformis]|uniref:Uncharacterized protein n=1 Tax=Irpex rosettiformis TaxID=378272 RepID=A0ACB8U5S6_9APHY|nr:hypothetical protein BDY19DRAFT_889505 [Irpex rosettiformis]
MVFTPRLAIAALLLPALVRAADPCAAIAGQPFVLPAKALACLKSFPFNETLKQNVLTNIARVFDFYTFEDFYLNSPPPFQESTTDIRADIARINATTYATDYDFNRAVYNFTTQLNDGHTRYFPNCYTTFQNLLPTPLVSFTLSPSAKDGTQSVFIAPDTNTLIPLIGPAFASFLSPTGPSPFNFTHLAGSRVLSINGLDPYAYADVIAKTESGNFLDHGVRVNSVFGSYRITGTDFSQRFGDISGPAFPDRDSLTLVVELAGGEKETVVVPYVADYLGAPFTDSASFWEVNCAANSATNGVDLKASSSSSSVTGLTRPPTKRLPRASIIDTAPSNAIGLPSPFLPTLPPQPGSTGVIKSFILPGNKTGVMFVGSFEGDFVQFQTDTDSAIKVFQEAGVERLLIDLTNNGGGFVCLGQFLHQYLAGTGFQSTNRANPLAQKIVAADIALGLNNNLVFYTADNFAFLNNTQMPASHNYITPSVPFHVNGTRATDQTSQRFLDTCDEGFSVQPPATPPFDLGNVAIVSNGNCASTCAMFSTLMFERHQTKIAIFGGKPGEQVQYKGMAGNQVLEWADLDTEIKTAGVKSDPLAPPDLLTTLAHRHNWRIAWSFFNEENPIQYQSELPQFRFAYTNETYNNPQKLWLFVYVFYQTCWSIWAQVDLVFFCMSGIIEKSSCLIE